MEAAAEDGLLALLADELDAVRGELERLGVALCENPDVARRHVGDLQSLDHIGQRQAAIASILRAPDRMAASRAAGLESIRRRLDGT